MDCLVVLGILNPDYYLGGKIKLDRDLALEHIEDKCANPVGMDPYTFSEGIKERVESKFANHIRTVLSVRGYTPKDYCVLSYGGAGPVFMSGYTRDIPFWGVFTVPWAATFSAYGCSTIDFVHRYQKSTLVELGPDPSDIDKAAVGMSLNPIWEELEERAIEDMEEEGFEENEINFTQIAFVRYGGQLEDVETESPVSRLHSPEDVDALLDAFEKEYASKYTEAAKVPEAGYQIYEGGLLASVPRKKPTLSKKETRGEEPVENSIKGTRDVYRGGDWVENTIYELSELKPGNVIRGPAIIEAPDTTLPIPKGERIEIDEYERMWLESE